MTVHFHLGTGMGGEQELRSKGGGKSTGGGRRGSGNSDSH